jgi:hypothetical protein
VTITTRDDIDGDDDAVGEAGGGEGADRGHTPSSYRDELLIESPFPTGRSSYRLFHHFL